MLTTHDPPELLLVMAKTIPKVKSLKLFLPVLLLIAIQESYASSGANETFPGKATADLNAEFKIEDETTIPTTTADTFSTVTPIDSDNTELVTLLPETIETTTPKDYDPVKTEAVTDVSESQNVTQPSINVTVVINVNINTETKNLENQSSSNEISKNNVLSQPAFLNKENIEKKPNSVGPLTEAKAFYETSPESADPGIDSSKLSPNELSKRILLSPDADQDPINIGNISEDQLDAWRPVWPFPNVNSVSIKPTVRFPSVILPQTSTEFSLYTHSEVLDNLSLLKQPVTAYYFDLPSDAPTKQVGPLFDPSYILESLSTRIQNNNLPAHTANPKLSSSLHDHDSVGANIEDSIDIAKLDDTFNFRPTPVLLNVPSSVEQSHITSEQSVGLATAVEKEENTDFQNSEHATIVPTYNNAATDPQTSTPVYTLGSSFDFYFTHTEPKSVKSSTTVTDPVIMPSILSSDELLKLQRATGDLSDKNETSLKTVSLFDIPIVPSDIPSPLFPVNVVSTKESTRLNPTPKSRIPLWKRLSKKKTLPDSILSPQTPSAPDLPDRTVLISTTIDTPVQGSIPFEDDIPIGILSPDSGQEHPTNKSNEENPLGEEVLSPVKEPVNEHAELLPSSDFTTIDSAQLDTTPEPVGGEITVDESFHAADIDEQTGPVTPSSSPFPEDEISPPEVKPSAAEAPIPHSISEPDASGVFTPSSETTSSTKELTSELSSATTKALTTTTTTTTTTTATTTTTTSTTTTSTTTPPTTVPAIAISTTKAKLTTSENVPDSLEYVPIAFENRTAAVNETVTRTQPADEAPAGVKIMVVVSNGSGPEPELNVVSVHENGTKSSKPGPFLKAALSYNSLEFCQHQNKIHDLLAQWIRSHVGNSSEASNYEVEIFYQPDCKNLYIPNGTADDLENRTSLYFYVKKNGQISPNLTFNYPRNPTNLEISQELEYLRKKILHLELINASSSNDILIEEAAVGTSIVVVVVVTILLAVLLIAAILAFFVIRRRRLSEDSHGRRCTPAVNDAYSLDSVSVFYHSLRRKGKIRASNKSLKSYLNQGFDDPNSPSRPLNFAKLTHFITDNEALYEEFSSIPSVVPKYDEMPRGVEDKNRYANVIPVLETRILLGGSKCTPCSEYINANSIHGPRGELRYYIATQAPLDNTVADFWQMIWEQESKVIVMLTDFVEKGIDKCADYLPPSETLDCHRVYREFQITLKSRDMREQYIVSLLQIKNLENNLVREIAHMWYTGWPQSGVPNEEKNFISFIFDVRTTRKQLRTKGPIIVHCSPGTGRTGTYIACDLCMRQFDEQKVVDIPKTVFRIRRERAGAVQTKEQYAFIYRVVNLYAAKLTTGNLDSF